MDSALADTFEMVRFDRARVEDQLRHHDPRMHRDVTALLQNLDVEGVAALADIGPSLFRWLEPGEQDEILAHSALWATVMRESDTLFL